MRVKLGKDYFDTNTKIFVAPSSWSSGVGKVKGNHERARFTNSLLESFRSKALDIQRQLMTEGKQISIDVIKNNGLEFQQSGREC